MRSAFSTSLVARARADKRVVLLTGDHGYALFDDFRRECPGQYINAGVAEQNMVGVAAGLAKAGLRPVVYGLAAFVPVRVLEQIKIDVCHEQLPVIFIGDGAGLVYSTLGTSHQSFEDIACLRAVPHIRLLSPCDAHEMHVAMATAFDSPAPTYIRMGKADLGAVHAAPPDMPEGRLLRLREGRSPVGFVATGSMVPTALALAAQWDASVWSAPWIKPLDPQAVKTALAGCAALVSLEEHSIYGGLGAAVLEALADGGAPPLLRIGIADRFSSTCGTHAHALREHGLDSATVSAAVEVFLRGQGLGPAQTHA